jgi:hypothetical protein
LSLRLHLAVRALLRERNSRVDGPHLGFGDWYLDWLMLTFEDLAAAAEAQSR